MIAFTPRFQALALALIMVVNAAPIRRDATTASSAPVATTTPIVKQEYINRLPVFVQAQAQASATSSTSARPSGTAAMASQGAQIAKAMGSTTKPAASSPTAQGAAASQGVKVAAKATTGAPTATTRAAMGSSTQPAASSPTAQGISIDVDPLVKIAIREPHHHHHNDGHHREKIIVNGDHDVVEARSPHHHHDHHDHDDYHREKVIVNGDHDHVEARSPHHHHHDHHGEKVEKVVINGDHDRVDLRHSRREHTYNDEPEVVVHGHDDHVETGDKHVDTRRALWTRDNAVPGTIQLVNGSSVAVASLVVDRSNASAPVLAASEQNSTQVRLVFMSPDDFSAAGMNGSSLTETEVPVQMQIEAFNPISAVTGVVGNVLQTLCATLGAVDSILALLGLELCPHQASAKSLFAFDTNTGTLRPFSGGQIVMGTNGTAGSMSMSVKDMSGNATAPNPAMTLVFTPSAIQLQLHDNSTTSGASAQDVSQEDDESSYVSAKAASTSVSAEAASTSVATKAASTKSSSSSSTSTPVRRRFTREY